jgi:hypothetical protein
MGDDTFHLSGTTLAIILAAGAFPVIGLMLQGANLRSRYLEIGIPDVGVELIVFHIAIAITGVLSGLVIFNAMPGEVDFEPVEASGVDVNSTQLNSTRGDGFEVGAPALCVESSLCRLSMCRVSSLTRVICF